MIIRIVFAVIHLTIVLAYVLNLILEALIYGKWIYESRSVKVSIVVWSMLAAYYILATVLVLIEKWSTLYAVIGIIVNIPIIIELSGDLIENIKLYIGIRKGTMSRPKF